MHRMIHVNQLFRNTFVSGPEVGEEVGLWSDLFKHLPRQSAQNFIEFCRLESLKTC